MKSHHCVDCGNVSLKPHIGGRWCEDCFDKGLKKDMNSFSIENIKNEIEDNGAVLTLEKLLGLKEKAFPETKFKYSLSECFAPIDFSPIERAFALEEMEKEEEAKQLSLFDWKEEKASG